MALGGSYQNGSNQNQATMFEPSYYSRLRFKNSDQTMELAFTFWKGTLKISVIELTNIQDAKHNELAYIHLSPMKAHMLAEGVASVINNETANDIYGVDTGVGDNKGFIAIGREMGVPFLFIAKLTPTSNGYASSQKFKFNSNYHYMIKVRDLENLKFQKEYRNNAELELFYNMLKDYSRFTSGALGASFYDIGRYESAKTSNMIRKIAERVGAYSSNGQDIPRDSFNSSSDSAYENNSSKNIPSRSRYQSIDDLESELG